MTAFIKQVTNDHGYVFSSYAEMHNWSITCPEEFWLAVIKFTGIKFSKPCDHVLINANSMPDAKWFSGAKLNFARHLLHYNNDKPAIIFHNESGERITLTYRELNQQVRRLAYRFQLLGIQQGDRIAGYLPNRPETIVAMLATTSIGAIWSSCSSDFGYHGVLDRLLQISPKILIGCESENSY